jgi:hypothetical protein
MKHLVFVEYGISKSQIKSCAKRNVKIKFIKTNDMCEVIPVYLQNYNMQWDSINIICNSTSDKHRSCLTIMGETITTSPLIEEYDKNRDKLIHVVDAMREFTDFIYIYTDLDMYSATLKKVCIDAFYKNTDINTSEYNDIFVSTKIASKDNNMSSEWSVVQGFIKRTDENVKYISHAKQNIFNDIPSIISRSK